MLLKIAKLIEFNKEDKFINGVNFNLDIGQVKKIVEYFKNQGKWTDYYYCEISDYELTNDSLTQILNLNAPFFLPEPFKYLFTLYQFREEKHFNDYQLNKELILIQSFFKENKYPCHFFICEENDLGIFNKENIKVDDKIDKFLLKKFINKNRQFDTENFDYFLIKRPSQEIYIGGKDLENIETEYSEGYWDEEE